jgi:hypothetical protein
MAAPGMSVCMEILAMEKPPNCKRPGGVDSSTRRRCRTKTRGERQQPPEVSCCGCNGMRGDMVPCLGCFHFYHVGCDHPTAGVCKCCASRDISRQPKTLGFQPQSRKLPKSAADSNRKLPKSAANSNRKLPKKSSGSSGKHFKKSDIVAAHQAGRDAGEEVAEKNLKRLVELSRENHKLQLEKSVGRAVVRRMR